VFSDNHFICEIRKVDDPNFADDACLMAAAPKLLEACEMFVAGYDNDDVTLVQYMGRLPALIANARAAIAATKGEPVCTGRRQARPV
jgi:hypothetical protein